MIEPEILIEIGNQLEAPTKKYIEYKQIVSRYDRGKHTALGRIMVRLRGLEPKMPMELLKATAYSNPEYEKYLENWDNAEKELIEAQKEKDTLENKLQAAQSYFAYERDRMRRLG